MIALHPAIPAAAATALACTLQAATAAAAVTHTDLYTLGTPPGLTTFEVGFYDNPPTRPVSGGEVGGFGNTGGAPSRAHAAYWSPAHPGGVDLNPAGYDGTAVWGVGGGQQVGGGGGRALLWRGSAASAVDLHPAGGYAWSVAYGTNGSRQVGTAQASARDNARNAILWDGTAASAVDLKPAGFAVSEAYATDGVRQVGAGHVSPQVEAYRALMWSGSAASAVDLHPAAAGYATSRALGVGGGQQVGVGAGPVTGDWPHALLWTGSAASAVNLNPAGYAASQAYDTNGAFQVGWAFDEASGRQDAVLWNGSAEGFVNLGAVLGAGSDGSVAYSIVGDTVYGLGYYPDGVQAVAWTLPEPGAACLLVPSTAGLLRRRRRPSECR
jgi:hypothetical protein